MARGGLAELIQQPENGLYLFLYNFDTPYSAPATVERVINWYDKIQPLPGTHFSIKPGRHHFWVGNPVRLAHSDLAQAYPVQLRQDQAYPVQARVTGSRPSLRGPGQAYPVQARPTRSNPGLPGPGQAYPVQAWPGHGRSRFDRTVLVRQDCIGLSRLESTPWRHRPGWDSVIFRAE